MICGNSKSDEINSSKYQVMGLIPLSMTEVCVPPSSPARRQTMKHAKTIYDELWDETRPLFQQDDHETDPLISDPNDLRRGLTVRAGLNPEVISKVEVFTDALRDFAPDQYFTPATDLHLTLLTIVSCHTGFNLNASLEKSYIEIISKCIQGIPPPRIKFSGVTASPSCVLLQGYPESNSLAELRNRLREQFKASALPHSIDSRYPIKTAHSTIMRFRKPQSALSELTRFLSKNRNRDFGIQDMQEIELVCNDWYHRKANTRIIASFPLKGAQPRA